MIHITIIAFEFSLQPEMLLLRIMHMLGQMVLCHLNLEII